MKRIRRSSSAQSAARSLSAVRSGSALLDLRIGIRLPGQLVGQRADFVGGFDDSVLAGRAGERRIEGLQLFGDLAISIEVFADGLLLVVLEALQHGGQLLFGTG